MFYLSVLRNNLELPFGRNLRESKNSAELFQVKAKQRLTSQLVFKGVLVFAANS